MVHGNDRAGLRQPITLDNCKAPSLPELFKIRIESCAAHDEGPKLPPKASMGTRGQSPGSPLDFISQVLEDPRHADDHRDSIRANHLDESCRMNLIREDD